jgi:hypothetical protein
MPEPQSSGDEKKGGEKALFGLLLLWSEIGAFFLQVYPEKCETCKKATQPSEHCKWCRGCCYFPTD